VMLMPVRADRRIGHIRTHLACLVSYECVDAPSKVWPDPREDCESERTENDCKKWPSLAKVRDHDKRKRPKPKQWRSLHQTVFGGAESIWHKHHGCQTPAS